MIKAADTGSHPVSSTESGESVIPYSCKNEDEFPWYCRRIGARVGDRHLVVEQGVALTDRTWELHREMDPGPFVRAMVVGTVVLTNASTLMVSPSDIPCW
jgi:hypothetical protein